MKTVGMYPLAVGGSHGGEADLALRHGEAGNEIHQHQHVLARSRKYSAIARVR
jgi:hypothetical protein